MVALLHARPYLFDREFHEVVDFPSDVIDEACSLLEMEGPERELPEPPPPTFSEAEIDAAREIAFAEGQREGRTTAERSTAARATAVLTAIAEQLRLATATSAQQQAAIVRDATALALAICRKLLPHTYRDAASEEITGLLSKVLPRISEQPQVFIRVAVELATTVSESVAKAVESAGFGGTVKVIGDESLAEGDCRIEWSQGGLVRDATTLLLEIESLIGEDAGTASGADEHTARGPAIESHGAAPDPDQNVAEVSGSAADTVDASQEVINPSQRAKNDA
jgi:Flagellar biosynthesis/type III secretory pathway protein